MQILLQILRLLFSRSSSPALGDFSSALLLSILAFNNRLQYAKTSDFAQSMVRATLISFVGFISGFILVLLIGRFTKPRLEETQRKERGREERQRLGYWILLRELFLDGSKGSFLAMAAMFFLRPATSPFSYGHYLIAAALASFVASVIQTLWLKFSDCLQRSTISSIS